MTRAFALATLLCVAACGSKSPAPTGPSGSQALAPGQWEAMDTEARAKFMGTMVKPTMKELFVGFDKDNFADFDCDTCHGAGVKNGQFTMPNPDLPKLTPQQIQTPEADYAAITDFMKTKVRPEMARLLGKPEWSPTAPQGFGCFDCHTQAQ